MNRIIVLDTETTGLPGDPSLPYTSVDNWPRLVQLAWQCYTADGTLLSEESHIGPFFSLVIGKKENLIEIHGREGWPLVEFKQLPPSKFYFDYIVKRGCPEQFEQILAYVEKSNVILWGNQ